MQKPSHKHSKHEYKNAIEVRNLNVKLNDHIILSGISFDITKGSITAVIGPNGSGKTTLLKALLGLTPITSGTVKVLGRSPKEFCSHLKGHHPDCKFHPGYVPQRFSFDRTFPITVFEFLSLALSRVKHHPEKVIMEKLQEVGMEKKTNAALGELSGGELQRVLIARSILSEPEILFLDEPSSGIDIGGERTFYELVLHLNKEHKTTCIIVSHELDIIFKYADQVLCVNKFLVCKGKPEAALTAKIIQDLYGESLTIYKRK